MTQTLTDEQTSIITEPEVKTSDDKPDSSHIVMSPDPNIGHQDYVFIARIQGTPVTALCGYTWVPQRSTMGLPVCQECKDIWESLPDDGEGWVKSNG